MTHECALHRQSYTALLERCTFPTSIVAVYLPPSSRKPNSGVTLGPQPARQRALTCPPEATESLTKTNALLLLLIIVVITPYVESARSSRFKFSFSQSWKRGLKSYSGRRAERPEEPAPPARAKCPAGGSGRHRPPREDRGRLSAEQRRSASRALHRRKLLLMNDTGGRNSKNGST